MKNQIEQPKKNIMKLFLIGSLFVFGVSVVLISFQKTSREIVFNSTGDNSVNYRVFLKENDFFEEPFLEAGKTYITSLIDHIDIDFKYLENFTDVADAKLSYYLKATISADKTDKIGETGTYWSKDYQLTDPVVLDFDDVDSVGFDTTVSIDYPYYNSVLESFRAQYPIASDGTIQIALVVDNSIYSNNFDNPLEFESKSSISLPLLEKAVEASVDVETGNQAKEFKKAQEDLSPVYTIVRVVGFLLIILSIVLMVKVILKRKEFIKHHQYISALDKILSTNDSIITNIDNMPSLAKFQKFEVKTFEELLDAYNEIRMPINFYQNKAGTESTFFITNDGIVWIYHLKKRNLGS
ncbi:hypothetical protein IKG45_02630 [Candidatus Saccharibacteria bacterium]|nr:hypothetical protein [Candidatus Saccharibacteria bacterium]